MSYVDALYSRDTDTVYVVERSMDGKRVHKQYPAKYEFFYPSAAGKHRSIFNEPLAKISCKSYTQFKKEVRTHSNKTLYEADLNQTFVCLSEYYIHKDPPPLNIAFFDIEVDFDPDRGYSSTEDAFMPITAVSVHLQWLDTLVCLAIPPKTLTMEQATELVKEFPNTFLFNNEKDLLMTFLDLIEDADILSGWNSTGYDIPYTVNRIVKVLSKNETRRLCLWDQFPKRREYEKFGKTAVTYDLLGRVHLDYLELYQKYTYEERPSYRLDYIGQFELDERKTVYEGTLDQLYNNDFKTFIEYNRQDTALLNKLDLKLKFINTANALAHANTVLLSTTMGAVAVTEQAIINEAHALGFKVPARKKQSDEAATQAAGAYVAYPVKGMHEWIGSLDINSLYPSAIRALNMGPETIVGQVRQTLTDDFINGKIKSGSSFAGAWEGIFGSLEYDLVMKQDKATMLTIDWEEGQSDDLTGAEIYNLIFESNNKLMISANGTIFSYEREGIIPGLLKKWYAERKSMQKTTKQFINLQYGIELPERFK